MLQDTEIKGGLISEELIPLDLELEKKEAISSLVRMARNH